MERRSQGLGLILIPFHSMLLEYLIQQEEFCLDYCDVSKTGVPTRGYGGFPQLIRQLAEAEDRKKKAMLNVLTPLKTSTPILPTTLYSTDWRFSLMPNVKPHAPFLAKRDFSYSTRYPLNLNAGRSKFDQII